MDTNHTCAEALRMALSGYPVFPVYGVSNGACGCGNPACQSPGKHPIPSLAPNGVKNAVSSKTAGGKERAGEIVLDWFTQYSGANYGIATGSASGLYVLDVDRDKGGLETLRQLEETHGPLPVTWTVTTGGGGRHAMFLPNTTTYRKNKVNVRPGIDWRAEGGYVVGPGSSHASGDTYRWETGPEQMDEPAYAPDWLSEVVGSDPPNSNGNGSPPRPTTVPPTIPEGMRDDTIFRLARSMRSKGLTGDEIYPSLVELNKRCAPPLSDAVLRAKAYGVERYAPNPPDAGVEPKPRRFIEAAQDWNVFITRSIQKPPSFVGDGIITQGEFGVFYGMPGLGKSWLALQLALSVASGTPWLGIGTTRARVGILSLELPAYYLNERLRALMLHNPTWQEIPEGGLSLICRPNLAGHVDFGTDEHIAQLEAWIGVEALQLVLVDPLSRVHLADENAAVEIAPVLNKLEEVRHATGCAIMPVHHERKPAQGKGGDDDMAALRGSGRLLSDPTSLIRLSRCPNGALRLAFTKLNYGPSVDPLYLRQGETGAFEVCDAPGHFGDANRAKVREAVSDAGPEGIGAADLADKVGLSKRTVYGHANALVEAGEVEPVPGVEPKRFRATNTAPGKTDEN